MFLVPFPTHLSGDLWRASRRRGRARLGHRLGGRTGHTRTRGGKEASRSAWNSTPCEASWTRDLPNTLKTVAKLGYEVVEFYSPYFNWRPAYAKDVRARMDDLGLRCYSTHNGFESFTSGENLAHAIELNQILGTRYVVLASAPGRTSGVDGWKNLCGKAHRRGRAIEAARLERRLPQSSGRMGEAGQRPAHYRGHRREHTQRIRAAVGCRHLRGSRSDPVAWVKANPGRIKVMHLKDWAPGTGAEEKGYRVLFGEGVTPWKELLAAAQSVGGIEYYLIEQEGSRFSEFETARRCLDNWKAMFGKA